MAGGGTNTSTSYQIPTNPTIENYINQTIPKLQATQDVAPLSQFAQPQQRQIAGMSPLQQYAAGMIPQIAQGNQQSQNALSTLGYGPSSPMAGYAPGGMNFGSGGQGSMSQSPSVPFLNPANANNGLDYGVSAPMSSGASGGPSQGPSLWGAGDEWGTAGPPPPGVGIPSTGQQSTSTTTTPTSSSPSPAGDSQSAYQNSALGQLAQLTGGPIGSSPATQAGMQAFQQNILPTLQNELGAMGLGRSGIAGEQIQRAATSAAVPLIQQEIANRAAAVPQYTNVAQAGANIGQQQVQNMGTAAGLGTSLGSTQQQLGQSVLDAPYQDYLRRQALSQSVTGLGGVPYQSGLSQTSTTPASNFFGK
jgi:hypothetical protein